MSQDSQASSAIESKRVASLLARSLGDTGIPARPAILDRIHIEMDKDDPDLNLLSRIISQDVALAGGLISIANSPFFGFNGRVRSVSEALMVLGLKVACRAVSSLILRKLFPVTPDMERFWDASSGIARLAGWLAQQADLIIKLTANDAYTFALFRDCGIAVLLNRFPYYRDLLHEANEESTLSFTLVEEKQCPTNHAIIGSLLTQSWWLPEEISEAIRYHHEYYILQAGDETVLPQTTRELVAITLLAEHIYQHHTGLSKTREWSKAGELSKQVLGVNDTQIESFYTECAPILAKFE